MVPRFIRLSSKSKGNKFSFSPSPPIASRVKRLIKEYGLAYIKTSRIFCLASSGSRSRAYARIWGLSRIWQESLKLPPAYILEVTHRFFELSPQNQEKVLLHELAHVPKNFSGALVGHNGIGKRVEQMIKNINRK